MSGYIETLHTNYNYGLSEFTGEYSDVESHYKATFHANISSPWMASRPNRLTWTRFYLLKALSRGPNSDIWCFRFGVRTRTSSVFDLESELGNLDTSFIKTKCLCC